MNCTIFALNRIFFQANEQATLKTKQPIRFRGLFRVTNQIAGNERQRVSCGKFCNFCFQNSYFFPLKMDECNFKPVQNCINKIFKLTKSYIWVISKCSKVVIEPHVVQFWSEIILVISNLTRTACSFDFETIHMISAQIALHSVQLPL